MKLFSRYIFQVFLWLGIWCLLWVSGGTEPQFIKANGIAFILQALLLLGLIYVAVPKFLFKKKYVYFFISVLPVILISAFIASDMGPPPIDRPPLPNMPRGPEKGPSRFLIHLLMLCLSCITAILLETFIFAQKKEKSTALAKAALMESELKFLKMQINPHFLFNALNNIYALSVTNSDKTQESISTLSEMLRYVIYDCEQPKVPLQKELDYIANYISLFKLKSSTAFKLSFIKEANDTHTLVAPMLFVPYIENAFKHSGIENGKDHFVHISLIQKDGVINFTVENSIATSINTTDKQGGIGLPNVQKRLEILYPGKHFLSIAKDATFKVHLKLLLS